MNKAELISAVAQQTGLTKRIAKPLSTLSSLLLRTLCPSKKRLFLSDSVPLR